ncbi:peptide deformylase [Streptomyces sp. NPDC002911]
MSGAIADTVLDAVPAERRRLVEGPEGCLSVRAPYRVVPRLDGAVVRRSGKDGRRLVIEGGRHFARCLQHATGHLGGHLYPDRLAQRGRKSALRDMRDLPEVYARHAAAAKRQRR